MPYFKAQFDRAPLWPLEVDGMARVTDDGFVVRCYADSVLARSQNASPRRSRSISSAGRRNI